MSASTALSKTWEGKKAADKFVLRQWLGSSDHSVVFLTDWKAASSGKAVIKLIRSANLDPRQSAPAPAKEDAQLSRWSDAARLSHPHLIKIYESGRCELEGDRFVYVVVEHADENLGEVLPLRALTAEEAVELLRTTAETLAYLHKSNFVHGRIKPSNLMAVGEEIKITSDPISRTGASAAATSLYDAPEVASGGLSSAADIWSLGATLVAVLTQKEPDANRGASVAARVEAMPQPVREIIRGCLQHDLQKRITAAEILRRLEAQPEQMPAPAPVSPLERKPRGWTFAAVAVVAILIAVFAASKWMKHPPPVPAPETHPAETATAPTQPKPAPSTPEANAAPNAASRGSVQRRVPADVSRGALNTIKGRIKVGVQVSVDASGNVTQTKLLSEGPSQYFAGHSIAAARQWKFNPPQVNGEPVASEWLLRFQFRRGGSEVTPTQTSP